MNDVKCKQCGLTYPKKKHECPYCHKKRFNPVPLIIIIVLCGVGFGGYYAYSKNYIPESIVNVLVPSNYTVNGIKFSLQDTTSKYIDYASKDEVTINFEMENTTNKDISFNFDMVTYVDDYVVTNSWLTFLSSGQSVGMRDLVKGKKMKQNLTLTLDHDDWNKIEVYYKPSDLLSDNTSDYKKLFIITKDEVTQITE